MIEGHSSMIESHSWMIEGHSLMISFYSQPSQNVVAKYCYRAWLHCLHQLKHRVFKPRQTHSKKANKLLYIQVSNLASKPLSIPIIYNEHISVPLTKTPPSRLLIIKNVLIIHTHTFIIQLLEIPE